MTEMRDFYIGEDGLEYCSNCHAARERILPHPIDGKPFHVHFMCEC